MDDVKMNAKVWIISAQKTDGRYNKGVVVGLDKTYEGLGYFTEKQYIRDFKLVRAKVAYVDVVTNRANAEWLLLREISKDMPKDATPQIK